MIITSAELKTGKIPRKGLPYALKETFVYVSDDKERRRYPTAELIMPLAQQLFPDRANVLRAAVARGETLWLVTFKEEGAAGIGCPKSGCAETRVFSGNIHMLPDADAKPIVFSSQ
jgi:hypothetical protein